MNIISIIRDNFRLTQAEIAAYLGVSRYYVNLMEHGKRDIPVSHSLKLFELYDSLMKHEYVAPARKSVRRSKSREDISYKISGLERRLKTMQELYIERSSRLKKIEILRKIPHDYGRELLYDLRESDIKDKLKCCDPEKQKKLQSEMERWKKML